jgi:ornithine cyclodeaminase
MLILNSSEVEQALPMQDLIDAMKTAYIALSAGHVDLPLRTKIAVGDTQNMALFMPAYLNHEDQEGLCLKTVSVFPGNTELGLPTIHAAVVVINSRTGQIEAILEGSRLTALRTGAASGAATELLSLKKSCTGAIIGAGVQGRTQLSAICSVRNLERVWVYDKDEDRALNYVNELMGRNPIPKDLRVASTPKEAVQDADIICTATTSTEPVFNSDDLKPGVHINGIGSYTPEMVEIPPGAFQGAGVFVGSKFGVLSEAGDILAAIEQGLIVEDQLVELGEVLTQQKVGRTSPDQVTVFKSVGIAIQDCSAAILVLKKARELSIGKHLEW